MTNRTQKQEKALAAAIETSPKLNEGEQPLLVNAALSDEIDEDPPQLRVMNDHETWDAAIDAAIELLSTRWAGPLTPAIVASLEELKR